MITLITPTGGRAIQIELCAEFMYRQDYKGDVTWIVVDDVTPITTDFITGDFRPYWCIKKIFPEPKWKPGSNTQSRNLLAGIRAIPKETSAIFIIEDDDYYSPKYISGMLQRLQGYDIVGEKNSIYYDVVHRGWIKNGNDKHASLFQTGFTPAIIPVFEKVCQLGYKFIDMNFFRAGHNRKVNLFSNGIDDDLAIGIKGLPGRPGIGVGHRMEFKMNPDPNLVKLKELIGEDYKYYE